MRCSTSASYARSVAARLNHTPVPARYATAEEVPNCLEVSGKPLTTEMCSFFLEQAQCSRREPPSRRTRGPGTAAAAPRYLPRKHPCGLVLRRTRTRRAGVTLRQTQFLSQAPCFRPDRALFFLSLWQLTWPIRLRRVWRAGVFPGSSATFCESFHAVFLCLLLLHRIQSIRPTRPSQPTPLRKLKIPRRYTRSWPYRRTRRRRWSNVASGCTRRVAPFATEPTQPGARPDQVSCAP